MQERTPDRLKRKQYESELHQLQAELCRLQEWVKHAGSRVIIVFEGRDAAGKGGTIRAITERVSPRVFRQVALPAPSDREKSQLYLQRYLAHFPAAGEIVIFDRSWYNRAGVELVMGFCSKEEHRRFLELCPVFEKWMVEAGIQLIKIWLEVGEPPHRMQRQQRGAGGVPDGQKRPAGPGTVRRLPRAQRHRRVPVLPGDIAQHRGGGAVAGQPEHQDMVALRVEDPGEGAHAVRRVGQPVYEQHRPPRLGRRQLVGPVVGSLQRPPGRGAPRVVPPQHVRIGGLGVVHQPGAKLVEQPLFEAEIVGERLDVPPVGAELLP